MGTNSIVKPSGSKIFKRVFVNKTCKRTGKQRI